METSTEENEQRPIILKFSENVINGMIPIEIPNLDNVIENSWRNGIDDYFCSFHYKFHFKKDELNYENDVWSRKRFDNIANDNTIAIRVPLFLSSYSLDFLMQIHFISVDPDNANIDHEFTVSSKNYSIQIPSVLLETVFKIDDDVQYQVRNAYFLRSGHVIELCDNEMIKIKTRPIYEKLDFKPEIVDIHKSRVLRQCLDRLIVVDITNTAHAHYNLVLRTENSANIQIYTTIYTCLGLIYRSLWNEYIIDDLNEYVG